MKDKFKQNFFIVLPAAIIAIIVFSCLTLGKTSEVPEDLTYSFWKILPYIFVLVTAIIGLNVFLVLTGGIVLTLIIGLCLNEPSITFLSMLSGIGKGMTSMYDISLISIVVAGIVELIKANGGIDAIIYAIRKCVKGKRGAQAGIAVLVTLVDFFTANNTVAIVIAGPIAKDIANDFDISPKRSAAILDIFGSFSQGIIPYGAQLLAAGSFIYQGEDIEISPIKIMPYLVYPIVMMLCAFLYIFVFSDRFGKKKKELALATDAKVEEASLEENKVENEKLNTEEVKEINSSVEIEEEKKILEENKEDEINKE